jgi:MFS family permease
MNLHRLALWTGVGSGLEYYAFITFALQAKTISILFFHNSDSALVDTFLIFAIGSVVTLFGGYLFGWFGDRLGRKKLLLLSISLMTLAMVAIGLLPTNLPFGLSIVLLILCRLIQGASVGGEIPGAIVFVYEHAQKHHIGFLLGILFLGIGLGAGISTGVNFLVADYFTPHQTLSFAWRIPFILAIMLGAAGYYLRRKSTESPQFEAYLNSQNISMKSENPLLPCGGGLGWRICLAIGLVFFPAILVSIGLYLPSYWMNHSTQNNSTIFLAMMVGFLVTALLLPVFGALGDHLKHHRLYLIGVILTLIVLPLLFCLLKINSAATLYSFNAIYYLLIVIMAACYPSILPDLFPIHLRYQLVALTYAGTYAIAGVAPFVASTLANPTALLIMLLSTGMMSLLAGIFYYRRVTS